MTANDFQGFIKTALAYMNLKDEEKKLYNKAVWSLSQTITTAVNKYTKALKDKVKALEKDASDTAKVIDELRAQVEDLSKDDTELMTPEERAEALAKLLDEKLRNGDISASEIRELKDIFNLKQKDQDIQITVSDFRGIDPNTADIVKAVEWQIMDYNESSDD